MFEPEHPERDLWGNVIELPLIKPPKRLPTIRKRASLCAGPSGETCGTCAHLASHKPGVQRFFKCGLVWNGGHSAASDIRKKDPSCGSWKPQPSNTQPTNEQ
ncbi:MAG: hypothetical protein ACQKBY_05075 [Verrucomicrobiales bacterium]